MKRQAVALALLGIVIAGCGVPPPNSVPPTAASTSSTGSGAPIKVGGIFDRTGATADVGNAYANGVVAYVNWLNSTGGVNGRPIELIDTDYAYKVENAERLYFQLVNTEQVVAIVGWGTADTEALRPRLQQDQIPFMSGSLAETLTDVAAAPYNFVVGVTYSDQMRIALQYILEQERNPSEVRLAFLYHDSLFGRSPEQALDVFAAAHDLDVLKVVMPRGATDLTSQMLTVNSFTPDYIIVQNTPGPTAIALRNAQTMNLAAQFILLNFAANDILLQEAGAAAEGVIGAMPFAPPSPDMPAVKTINEYLQRKSQTPLTDPDKGLVFSQGWTIMAVMAEGIRRAASTGAITGQAIRAELEALQNFDTGGITAPITFGPDDHKGATSLQLYQVKNNSWTAITGFMEAVQ